MAQPTDHQTEDMKKIDMPLSELIAEKRLDLALRNIDHDLTELSEKIRKPRQQLQHVAENWRVWRHQAAVAAGVLAVVGLAAVVLAKNFKRFT